MVELALHSEQCFAILLDDAVNDRSLAMTSSFTNMVVLGMNSRICGTVILLPGTWNG